MTASAARSDAVVARLVAALAGGLSVKSAAEAVGVSERTARRWQATPEFKAASTVARDALIAHACGLLALSATQAATTLKVLLGPEHPAAVRLRAATAILELTARLGDHVELSERIGDLERQVSSMPIETLHAV